MDVTVEIRIPEATWSRVHGQRFAIEVGYFDKVREIKEKVQRRLGIRVAAQRLFLQDRELDDDRTTEHYAIVQGSRLLLLLRRLPEPPRPISPGSPPLFHVTATLLSRHNRRVSVFASRYETVAALKRRIHRAADMAAPELERMAAVCGNDDEVMRDSAPLLVYAEPESGVMEVKIAVRWEVEGTSINSWLA